MLERRRTAHVDTCPDPLLKWAQYREDTEGYKMELRYLRDIEGREVDFVVTENAKPVLMVECKSSDRDISPPLKYFKTRFPDVAAWQVSAQGIRVAPALKLLSTLIR
jgi:uncharacterized protein